MKYNQLNASPWVPEAKSPTVNDLGRWHRHILNKDKRDCLFGLNIGSSTHLVKGEAHWLAMQ